MMLGLLAPAAGGDELRVMFIGNSLTEQFNRDRVDRWAQQHDDSLTWAIHIKHGQPIGGVWLNRGNGIAQDNWAGGDFGQARDALREHRWDAITLQPFRRTIADGEGGEAAWGDLRASLRWIDYAGGADGPPPEVFIYQTWPMREGANRRLAYREQWLQPYGEGPDAVAGSFETRAYVPALIAALTEARPGLADRLRVVPAGEVLFHVNEAILAGELPYEHINELYRDDVHLNNHGQYIVALTWYATLFGQDPSQLDLSGQRPREMSVETAQALAAMTWEVVDDEATSAAMLPNP